MGLIPKDWLPACTMRRVHIHWTAGKNVPTELDREHYHILIPGDLKLVRGVPSIRDNAAPMTARYAAHTLNANSGAIGVSLCGMLDAVSASKPGPYPITADQWALAAEVVSELCRFYQIPVSPSTVLQHSEVQANLGITQRGKWDVSVLPWMPELPPEKVYENFRRGVAAYLDPEPEPARPIGVTIKGAVLPGILVDGMSMVSLRSMLNAALVKAPTIVMGKDAHAVVVGPIASEQTPLYIVAGSGYVSCRTVARIFGLPIEWNPEAQRVVIG